MTETETWVFHVPEVQRAKCGEWMGKAPHGNPVHRIHHWFDREAQRRKKQLLDMWTPLHSATDDSPEALRERFTRLADAWSQDTAHLSSATALINDPSYQQIIDM